MKWVKSYNPDGTCTYFRSIEDCCKVYGIKYHNTLVRLIDTAGLAPDGRTFFDYPSKWELKELERKYGSKGDEDYEDDRYEGFQRRDEQSDAAVEGPRLQRGDRKGEVNSEAVYQTDLFGEAGEDDGVQLKRTPDTGLRDEDSARQASDGRSVRCVVRR